MLTWRAAVVALVVALAIAVIAPSVRVYLDQQATLADLRAEAAAAQDEVDDLTAEVARWDDPAFVVAQARERLAYVFPGETPYRVVDAEVVDGPAPGSPAAEREPEALAGASWYDRLWDSVVDAGQQPTVGAGDAPSDGSADAGSGEAGDAGEDPAAGAAEEPGEEPAEQGEQLTDVDFGG